MSDVGVLKEANEGLFPDVFQLSVVALSFLEVGVIDEAIEGWGLGGGDDRVHHEFAFVRSDGEEEWFWGGETASKGLNRA